MRFLDLTMAFISYQDGQTALHCAAGKGYIVVMGLLLDKGADVNITLNSGQMKCCTSILI